MKYFISSIIITIIGLFLALYLGGIEAFYIVTLLIILEVSLSFDNAVVNVKVLEKMEEKWQKRFLTWGMLVAVFGMRFVFPILIVAIASGTGLLETFNLALNDATTYHAKLVETEKLIFAFGGAFLLMVFFKFLFDTKREEKWITSIENNKIIIFMGKVPSIRMLIAMAIGILLIIGTSSHEIALAYFSGVLLYSFISLLDDAFMSNGIRSGIMGFLYLEVLDASFSFDGVIGAFALSSDIFVIMIGLGVGAMFVRSLTIYMLKQETLTEYRYLEHGAHYAILALAGIMLIKIFIPVNELIVGTIGFSFIALATYHSVKREKVTLKAS